MASTTPTRDLEKNDFLSDQVLDIYKKRTSRRTRPSLQELATLLFNQISSYDRTYIVIDALDECPEANGTRQQLLDVLRPLRSSEMKTSLLVTSRVSPSIELEFERHQKLEISADSSDIRKYVHSYVQGHRTLARHVDGQAIILETITETLVRKAQGMFLLAQLQMNALSSSRTLGQLRRSLDKLPETFDAIYANMMLRIEEQQSDKRNLAYQILLWISHSQRPLTVRELQCALALESGAAELDIELIPVEHSIDRNCGHGSKSDKSM